mmetsp:Transcript_31680/g.53229  ORF Transcript_31680/g.53229 Transcript_31680/m.53229 type:complete len:273 (+) Transcript_31680:133-951(+)|eukprot:CAMPEP_0198211574 /NCGR_PEP_ID=MMETSP1445-20131203/24527_1 /TAXON_ID=36898 /ORGANISM="Pyramimonas sp., Strain CCMP2087" /LENGTH=272 /DNA_ID=CAMNT_0043885849 /DNA_START=127 /DNA_END=945 /DNA_ORIENTATION=+
MEIKALEEGERPPKGEGSRSSVWCLPRTFWCSWKGGHSQNRSAKGGGIGHYGNGVVYWDARYKKDSCGVFDWYQSYSALKPIVNKYIPDKNAKILMVGCGTSNLGEDMFLDGYTNIVNTDVSPVCIEFMAKKHEKYHGMTYVVDDVCSMQFPDEHFDAAIDKGTMDTLMCEDGSWDAVQQMMLQLDRVLTRKSTFLEITYGEPSARFHWLSIPTTWKTSIFTIAKTNSPPDGSKSSGRPDEREYSIEEAKVLEAAGKLKDVHFVYASKKRAS